MLELLSEGQDHFSLFYAHYTMSSIVLRRAGLGWDFLKQTRVVQVFSVRYTVCLSIRALSTLSLT